MQSMEEKVEWANLYDFYGELLNGHQRKLFEEFVFDDLSLAEIAEQEGISRQGVHDVVRRCTRILEGYEEKLHLVAKFRQARGKVERISQLAQEFRRTHEASVMEEVEKISIQILEEL